MSTGQKLPYTKALKLAQAFIRDIRDKCERIEIAGSLRRHKPEVGDIEIVCIPKIVQGRDLFGGPGAPQNLLEEYIGTYHLLKNGPKFKQIALASINIDLFITTPAQWGVIYTIRTGCAEFSHWLVTQRRNGGALPSNMRVNDGRIWIGDLLLETPAERDVFDAVGLHWIEPEDRTGPRTDCLMRR
jgi:DNA polymerase/3'-5' exonuclease PolX